MITPFISHLELITPMELVPSQGLPVAGTESWRCGKLRSAVDVFRKDRDVFLLHDQRSCPSMLAKVLLPKVQ